MRRQLIGRQFVAGSYNAKQTKRVTGDIYRPPSDVRPWRVLTQSRKASPSFSNGRLDLNDEKAETAIDLSSSSARVKLTVGDCFHSIDGRQSVVRSTRYGGRATGLGLGVAAKRVKRNAHKIVIQTGLSSNGCGLCVPCTRTHASITFP